MKQAVKLVANNKKAYHDYFIDEKFECGIELFGTEVKSIRMGKCSIKEAFVRIDNHNEVWVYGMHINPYEKGNIFNKDPLRARKLLMHKHEIIKLSGKTAEKGYTLVPLQVYFKNRLRSAWPGARSFTISGKTLPKRIREGSCSGNLR